ncbi:AAA family ATPase [Campylobacter concisus]|jgi:ATP/GTP-binding protein|uniref:AAA family ATPase n=1 Tax=Campylobacter concisus TaxID=199 RepID=UPI003D1D08EF
MIKQFKINGLFGFRNVEINFEDNIKILIGENGFGKTTVLNSLYYLLNGKYIKLSKIEFESIELFFTNKRHIQFSKSNLDDYINYLDNDNRRLPSSIVPMLEKLDLSEFDDFNKDAEKKILNYVKDNKIRQFAPDRFMAIEIFRFITERPNFEVFDKMDNIRQELKFSILYLPTYRRVEEDLKNLGVFEERGMRRRDTRSYYTESYNVELADELDDEETLIHFGMNDVKQKIKSIKQEIERSTITGFSKLTGQMLSHFLHTTSNDFNKIESLDKNTIRIILHRVGDNISKKDKESILNLLDKKTELSNKSDLVFFIFKLIDIYNAHKHLDDKMKKFRDVCNQYLFDKEVVYDESLVDLYICRKNTEEKVEIDKLSSGEKQIVSIFSKIYLEKNEILIVLFDEPELSLSLPWQKRLLPDIIESGKCKFLLAVTHSPFIFDNELEKFAVGIDMYMNECNE